MEELDKLRKSVRNTCLIGYPIAIILFILAFFSVDNADYSMIVYVIAALVVVLATFIIYRKKNRNYKGMYKELYVADALKETFDDLQYVPNAGIPFQTIAATGMIDMGNTYHSEDYISASYKGTKFVQSDVVIQDEEETVDSDGHTQTTIVTIFKGRWLIFDFNKEFKANVQIAQKGFNGARTNGLFTKKENRYQKVEMESESFNKKFRVYAQSAHEAFYIITPAMMERIERLENANGGKMIFCFVNNQLHIGINDGRDSFEPGSVFKKIDDNSATERVRNDIRVITQFVDELNLDNDLFKKEEN